MLRKVMLAILSGLILSLPFVNGKLWLFAWFGFVPLFFAIEDKSPGKAFLISYFCGIIFWSLTIYWLVHVTLLGQILLILYLALYFGIFGLLIFCLSSVVRRPSLLFIPSVWVLLEYLRSHLLTGFPWALLAYSQYKNLPVIQIADITGAWGVSFLVMWVNVAIFVIARRHVVPTKQSKKRIAMTIILLSFVIIYGYYKIHEPRGTNHEPRVKVSVIQGNIPQELKWDTTAQDFILQRYIGLTQEAAKDNPDLIIWPEASSPELFGTNGPIFKKIFSLSGMEEVPLVIGTVTREEDGYFNSALLIERGQPAGRYDKLHLVPFGEYIPFKKFLPFLETVVPIGDITAGKEYKVFSHQPPKFSVLICFEDLFPELSREFVKRGADFLVNITNDAWYKKTSAPYQHLAASVFRAVENRVFLARAANTGISGFIGPDGKIISAVKDETGGEIFVTGYQAEEIRPEKNTLTFYTRYGEVFIFLLLIFVVYSILRLK